MVVLCGHGHSGSAVEWRHHQARKITIHCCVVRSTKLFVFLRQQRGKVDARAILVINNKRSRCWVMAGEEESFVLFCFVF